MKLIFSQEYKSIYSFNEVEVPDFCVLTGKNGSGKTHLLEAIERGHVKYSDFDTSKIGHFNFQSFQAKSQITANETNFANEKELAWQQFAILKNVYFQEQQDENGQKISDDISHMNKDEIIEKLAIALNSNYGLSDNNSIPDIVSIYSRIVKEFLTLCEGKTREELKEITKTKIINYLEPVTKNELILNNLSQIFFNYRMKIIMSALGKSDGGEGKSEEEIADIEKNSPWNILHEMLEILELPQKFTIPKFKVADIVAGNSTDYNTHLNYNNQTFDFDSLSSGEKVLFALALVMFQNQRLGDLPQLLLLDEVDATLHPSMIKNLLQVIKDIFLENGCKVILATHSPTTISLVEESAIFKVEKGDSENKIEKIFKKDAVEILSEGLMSLEKGIKLFDQISQKKLSIMSEGNNVQHIKKAFKIIDKELLHKIDFIEDIQSKSGSTQLKILFDFFKLVEHENHILFVFDCDVKMGEKSESNKDHFFIFDRNHDNEIAKNGIENIYPKILFNNFVTCSTDSHGNEENKFDEKRKKDFLNKIFKLSKSNYFENYHPLIKKIKTILETAKN